MIIMLKPLEFREKREEYAQKLVKEAIELEEKFEDLIDNTIDGKTPDLHEKFQWLEGTKQNPLCGLKWGKIDSASMLRIYAVEVEANCLIIVYGGIKVRHCLSECPLLDSAVTKVNNLIAYLEDNNAITISGLEELVDDGNNESEDK